VIIFTFNKTRDAIKADSECKVAGFGHKVIPVPRSISSQCGMAIEVDSPFEDRLSGLLKDKDIAFKTYDKAKVKL